MKKIILIGVVLAGFSVQSQARTLLTVHSESPMCIHCHNSFSVDCEIDDDGTVKVDKDLDNVESTKTRKISSTKIKWIEKLAKSVKGTRETRQSSMCDGGAFEVDVYRTDDDQQFIDGFQNCGEEVHNRSLAGLLLKEIALNTCHMKKYFQYADHP